MALWSELPLKCGAAALSRPDSILPLIQVSPQLSGSVMRFAPALWTLALSATASLAHAGITDIVGFQGVRVWEVTYSTEAADFAAGDPRLVNTLPGAALSYAGRDFGFFLGNENYDLYFSDADGTLNALGSYLTIDGNCDCLPPCFNVSGWRSR